MAELKDILSGKTSAHIENNLHKEAIASFKQLQELGKKAGLQIEIVSGFRNYEKQLLIWEEKLDGKRAVYNYEGTATLNINKLPPEKKVESILRWSAYPGASRHHWGTDFDIFDANQIAKENLKLIPQEYSNEGPMSSLNKWLEMMITSKKIPFNRPYSHDVGGIAIEPWHISYEPLASEFMNHFNLDFYIEVVESSAIIEKEVILKQPEYYYNKYFLNQ